MSDPQHPEPVVVQTYAERGEAEVGLARLRDAGVHGQIIDEVEGGLVPVDGEFGGRRMGPAAEAETARAALA